MKILLLTQVLPFPSDSGPKVKTLNLIKFLTRRHEITLISFVRGDQSRDIRSLKAYCKEIWTFPMSRSLLPDGLAMIRSLLSGEPWMILRDDRKGMRRLVKEIAGGDLFDLIIADQLNMMQYAQIADGPFLLFDAHNALWSLYRRLAGTMPSGPEKWLLNRDWRLLKRYEGRICREVDAVTAVTPEDRTLLLEAAGDRTSEAQIPEIIVIPITVDTEEVKPVERSPTAERILHIGTMYWPPNIDGISWFSKEIWPRILNERPDAHFDIVGARPSESIKNLPSRYPGIQVSGYVEDLEPFLRHCGVFIVPLRSGGGMRVKILNALAQGLPIVSTSLGCEGIAATDGKDILIADDPQEFASAVLRLLADPQLGAKLGRNGRALAEEVYDLRRALLPLEGILNQIPHRAIT